MTAETPALVRSFRVGKRWTCTLTIARPRRGDVVHSVIEWSPDVPQRLKAKEFDQYRAGRNAAVAELAALISGNVLLVEV